MNTKTMQRHTMRNILSVVMALVFGVCVLIPGTAFFNRSSAAVKKGGRDNSTKAWLLRKPPRARFS